jgi:ligand-binding SRPBCC domain-containing protein
MTIINLTTNFSADINKCFDLTRDVDAHKLSAKKTNERVIAGRTTGLCQLGDKITWEAKHFGIKQRLTVEITKMDPPNSFEDIMIKGAFKSMKHIHSFKLENGMTFMLDHFEYEVPFGLIGRLFDKIILEKYMTRFLQNRNQILKEILEK